MWAIRKADPAVSRQLFEAEPSEKRPRFRGGEGTAASVHDLETIPNHFSSNVASIVRFADDDRLVSGDAGAAESDIAGFNRASQVGQKRRPIGSRDGQERPASVRAGLYRRGDVRPRTRKPKRRGRIGSQRGWSISSDDGPADIGGQLRHESPGFVSVSSFVDVTVDRRGGEDPEPGAIAPRRHGGR